MKNRFFTTLFFALVGVCSAFAQDFIVLKTGSEIKSKIVELTPTEVKYKAFDNLDGPTITIEKATVFMLRYQNGKSEVVNALAAKTEAAKDPSVKKPKNEFSPTPTNKNSGFTGTVFGGVALPLGSYATKSLNDNDNASGAKLGFSAGIQVGYRFNPMLSLLCEAQYALNAYAMTTEDVATFIRYVVTGRISIFCQVFGLKRLCQTTLVFTVWRRQVYRWYL